MSRGLGTHQRAILTALHLRGWAWVTDLPYSSRADYTSYWRAIRRLERLGHLRVEHRRRAGYLAPRALLVSVTQVPAGTALPIDEHYWAGTRYAPDGDEESGQDVRFLSGHVRGRTGRTTPPP